MITDIEIMKYFEMLRTERKINIQDITEGIVSRRNYSRYVSGEIAINIETLSKLLAKIEVPLSEFSFYINNRITMENLEEQYFHALIRNEQYTKAYNKYYSKIKNKELKTIYAKRTIPLGIVLMKYKLGMLNRDEVILEMIKIMHLDEILRRKIVHDDDIESLYLYIRICSEKEKEKIVAYLLKIILDKEYKMATCYYEICVTLAYLTLLTIMVNHSEKSKYERNLIEKVMNLALEFNSRAKAVNNDVLLFEILYKYIKRYEIENKYVVFYYIASILATEDPDFLDGKTFEITKEDIELYYECLSDEEFMSSAMYERIIDYDNL